MHEATDLPVTGFESQEFDFGAVFDRKSADTQNLIFETVVTPIVVAETDPSAGNVVALTIVGHADRYDEAGHSPQERRAVELDAATQRARSAADWVFDQVFKSVEGNGGTPPVDLASAQTFTVFQVPAGAADLLHTEPAGEDERQQNRRVQFLISTFTP
jgi:outer membrane protein OmpA-like peptidoglycan-associated protein